MGLARSTFYDTPAMAVDDTALNPPNTQPSDIVIACRLQILLVPWGVAVIRTTTQKWRVS